ncbi:hypothetical protein PVT67_02950 [Gallaecimonas kandeliae]|uniref:hypothetical protein n=1 Tax=Gallaecimonas kandeliae TaxID=3029055 RepID=UPI002649B437|nr:hypothetical protein [Gallaecimonas kandeliae]WKE66221.1 hypothetical protein PVT67_02950 [Gallaecimonas kandeliae]
MNQEKDWLSPGLQAQLVRVIAASFGGVDARAYLTKYFLADGPFARTLRLYFAEGSCVGYCLLTFTRRELGGKSLVVIGASAAFLPEYRKGGRTLGFSLTRAFGYWLRHPFERLYYADTMLSPAMYRAIVKHTAIAYPSPHSPEPDAATAGLFETFNPDGRISPHYKALCLVDTGRFTAYDETALNALKSSAKPEIACYCRLNPDFHSGVALFVIIPVSMKQLLRSAWKFCRAWF